MKVSHAGVAAFINSYCFTHMQKLKSRRQQDWALVCKMLQLKNWERKGPTDFWLCGKSLKCCYRYISEKSTDIFFRKVLGQQHRGGRNVGRFLGRGAIRAVRRLSGCRKRLRIGIIEWIWENLAGRIERTWRLIWLWVRDWEVGIKEHVGSPHWLSLLIFGSMLPMYYTLNFIFHLN